MQTYFVLHANGTYSVQNKTNKPSLYENIGFNYVIGLYSKLDSVTGHNDSTAGDTQQRWGRWTLAGDSLKFGRDGRYEKYPVVLQGSELKLVLPAEPAPNDKQHHRQCMWGFTRADAGKLPPTIEPGFTCQTLAGPVPTPRPLALKMADLIGTWVTVDDGYKCVEGNDPLCAGFEYCDIAIDTLTLRANGTLTHNVLRNFAFTKSGQTDTSSLKKVVELRWWLVSDTLWRALPEPSEQKPIAATVSLEDNGRYLFYLEIGKDRNTKGRLYQRATVSKP